MISAFGVQHSIAKSYVPGEGYKAARNLTDIERHIVRNKALGNMAHWKTAGTPEKRAPKEARELYPGIKTPRGKLKQVFPQFSRAETGMPRGIEGFSMPNGRGGGHAYVHRDAEDPANTYRHEMAHLAPRRNPKTFQDRMADHARKGREEGRADFIASGKTTTGQYPGNETFQRGYNEVQGKMAAAKWKKQNLKKSFIPGKGYVKATELDQFGRYGLKLATKKKQAASAGTIPGLGKTSGVAPQRLNRSPYFARQAKKEAVRSSRLHSGKKVSDVKYRGPR